MKSQSKPYVNIFFNASPRQQFQILRCMFSVQHHGCDSPCGADINLDVFFGHFFLARDFVITL